MRFAPLWRSGFFLCAPATRPGPVGPAETFPVNVRNLGNGGRSKLELDLAAGELNLRAGVLELLKATAWIRQPGSRWFTRR